MVGKLFCCFGSFVFIKRGVLNFKVWNEIKVCFILVLMKVICWEFYMYIM